YSGDGLNNGDVDDGVNESLNVVNAGPSISTMASFVNPPNSNVVGTAGLTDKATITGGFNPTGTIKFTITRPDNTTVQVGGLVTVNGAGMYSPTTTVLATQVGTYVWHATYSGDANNAGASDNGTNESLTTIKASPTITTMASFVNPPNSNV